MRRSSSSTKSVPAKFLDKAYIKAFEQQMRADILKLHPNATVELKLTRDQYYDHLAKEVLDPPDLIICQSDGLIIGDPQPRHKAMLAKLPPVIFAHVVEERHYLPRSVVNSMPGPCLLTECNTSATR